MALKFVFIIYLTAVVANTEPIGDFAPLEVGNVWVYSSVFQSPDFYSLVYHIDSSFLTIELLNIEEKKDTTFFAFKNLVSGRIIRGIDTDSVKNTFERYDTTYYSDSLYFDTLYEFEGTIANYSYSGSRKGIDYPLTLPVYTKHDVDTPFTNKFDSLQIIDNVIEYTQHNFPGGFSSTHGKYRAGIGLHYYEANIFFHGWGGRTTTLLSFSRKGKIIGVIHSHKQKVADAGFTIKTAKSTLLLPQISIVQDDRAFNLLGRVTKGGVGLGNMRTGKRRMTSK